MIGFGQNFMQIQNTPFRDVCVGSVAFSDVDNDGDEDVLISGYTNGMKYSELYQNDGLGNFTLVANTPFTGVFSSSIAFSDVDNDGDEDVLIVGTLANGISGAHISELFTNNGLGNFSLVTGTPFNGCQDGSIAFSDIDNDGDEDVLITGRRGLHPNYNAISELYTNDGLGNFSLLSGTPFPDIWGSWIGFSDVDGDGDEDVLITGRDNNGIDFAGLYTNDGVGNFTLVANTPFQGVYGMNNAFSDIDNDGDEDVLIAGKYCISQVCSQICELYTNDGSGNFSLVNNTSFPQIVRGDIGFSDVDNDGDKDFLITGAGVAELYQNDGSGIFSLVNGTPFTAVYSSSIAFSDVDNDGDEDVLIIGSIDAGYGDVNTSSLYRNNTNTILNNINDFNTKNQKILEITNILGQPTKKENNTPLFYIYDDGTVEKKIIIE